jgi:signal transduction histidine kinase
LSTFSKSIFTKQPTKNFDQYNALHSLLISLLIVGHIRLIQILSFSNKVKLSINDLSKIELSGIAVFFSILLIQAGIFIYAVNFIKNMKRNGDKKSLYLSLVLSTTSASILIYFFHLELNVFFTFLFFLSFFILLDLFLDVTSKSITWIIWWGIFFGLYLSALFFNYDIKREIQKRSDLLKSSFVDVKPEIIDSLVKNETLVEINNSLAELLILPDEANYDKSDIVSFLRKKHNNQNIKIDILHNYEKSYFNELGDTSVFEKKSPNYYFDNLLNVLWYSQDHQDSLKLFTGIEISPTLLNDIPYIYKKDGHQLRHNLALNEEIFTRLNKQKDSHFFANSNAYIKHIIDDNTFIVSRKSFSSILKPIALFSFLFSFIIILVIGLGVTSHWIVFLSKTWPYNIKGVESLNSKIQIALILVILLSFILIAFITSSFLKTFIDNKNETYRTEQLETLSRDLNSRAQLANSPAEAYAIGTNYKNYIETIHNVDLTFNALTSNEFQQEYFPLAYFTKYKDAVAFSNKDSKGNLSYLPFKFENELIGFVKVSNRSNSYQELNVFDFLGSIFNVYVFLFLIASVLAVFIARSITKPLSILNQKMSQLKFGKRNELITWEGEDEIGTLIGNYNNMVNQLEDSAQLLAKTERDSAWREMAKQVAHEIKNPLTPMKMYIQHLEKAIKQKPEEAHSIAKKIATTLLEQVENLTQIANSFGNFAELPKSSNEKIELNTVVEVVHNLFRKRDDMDIKLSEPIDTIYVYADKNQLIRILNNLVKNATEAIPKEMRGFIHLHLYQKENKAIIKITDNGMGIPDEMKDKVFQPKFTTKDSGSGLGLAIALNMIESMNGRLYFESVESGGTSFIIELDIIRSQSMNSENRIILE